MLNRLNGHWRAGVCSGEDECASLTGLVGEVGLECMILWVAF
jgi:hypothetical protein